jgi:hypothetical protein
MAFQNLSANAQYSIGGCSQFPNQRKYVSLAVKNSKSRLDQRMTRKVEAITADEKRFKRLLSTRNPAKRRIYIDAVSSILRHQYDQSILASEKGQFPSLPKASVAGNYFPERGLSLTTKKARLTRAALDEPLQNVFMPTKFQILVDAQQTTPVTILSGREQPLGGSEGAPEQYRLPLFIPNAVYGGTPQRYR